MDDQHKDLGTQGRENTVKGKLDQAVGKVQEKVGEATGNTELEAKGKGKQVKGKAQTALVMHYSIRSSSRCLHLFLTMILAIPHLL